LTDISRVKELLTTLVSFDTETSKSNLPLIDWVAGELWRAGVDFVLAPNAAGDKAALYASIGPKIDGGIVLSGHTDVVPVKGQSWTTDPFELREAGGRLYGRGACDMKGFVAICLALVPAMKAATLKRPIHILLSYDEETTCLGPMDIIARFGQDLPVPAAVIVGEPTNMDVATAQKSIATYRTRVHGHEAHSAKPYLGVNAIPFACRARISAWLMITFCRFATASPRACNNTRPALLLTLKLKLKFPASMRNPAHWPKRWRSNWQSAIVPLPCPMPPKPDAFKTPESPRWSAAPGPSIRRTSPMNISKFRSWKRAYGL